MSLPLRIAKVCEEAATPEEAAKLVGLPDGWTLVFQSEWRAKEPGVLKPYRSVKSLKERLGDLSSFFSVPGESNLEAGAASHMRKEPASQCSAEEFDEAFGELEGTAEVHQGYTLQCCCSGQAYCVSPDDVLYIGSFEEITRYMQSLGWAVSEDESNPSRYCAFVRKADSGQPAFTLYAVCGRLLVRTADKAAALSIAESYVHGWLGTPAAF